VPDLTVEQLTLALAIVAGVAALALLVVFFLAFRLRRIRRDLLTIRGEGGTRDLATLLGSWSRKLEDLHKRVDLSAVEANELATRDRFAIQNFHLVRYDAFEDMGGRLSFSAALLDDHGDGLVITSINGRTETRTYAKPIRNLNSDHNLSDEEGEAIAGAVARSGRGTDQVVSR
jgi:Protein of unknown function (DUF4446)